MDNQTHGRREADSGHGQSTHDNVRSVTVVAGAGGTTIPAPPTTTSRQIVADYCFEATRGPMMQSRCHRQPPCEDRAAQAHAASSEDAMCAYCRYSRDVAVPLPEEVYADNLLRIRHQPTGATIEFNALDALGRVSTEPCQIQVAYAKEWSNARSAHKSKLVQHTQFDWTYTSDYTGTLSPQWQEEPTDEQLDLEALKQPEKILFFSEGFLFADDYGDNGAVNMTVKIRVMPSSFLVLQRLFVRVDQVVLRIYDTRLYHKFGTDHVLRDVQHYESPIPQLEPAVVAAAAAESANNRMRGPGGARMATRLLYDPQQAHMLIPHMAQTLSQRHKLTTKP